jgi:hypothetical protein
MPTLEKSLRNQFERTVKSAREVAEKAAGVALAHLGVGEAGAPGHLSDAQKELRRRLRIHGRQIGDRRGPEDKTQEIDLLVEETAYEHWHRMLFARFLAENDLLMYPDPDEPVAVSLEECEDLAADEGAESGWELAAQYAARMLPRIFRVDSPVFAINLPPEHQRKLEKLLGDLPAAVFTASDAIGWAYQFWQSKRKDEVNASGVKIGARELPAVTQLFTEPYMVSFLLDNSLGAWWAARRLSEADLKGAGSEEELREKASLPGVPLAYLRFVKDEDGTWTPAAGTFDGWPAELKDLKVMDPCCGSGHFLVAVFVMLTAMRMALEGLSAADAVDEVLTDNLHGLEIDKRCVELAAFALALAAWRYPDAGGYRELPEMALACSGLAVSGSRKEWEKLANGDGRLRVALSGLYDQFQDAPVLGSLINPGKKGAAGIIEGSELADALERALGRDRSEEEYEVGVVAHGIARGAGMLADKYHLMVTNVPYLGISKHNLALINFIERRYPVSKYDLALAFIERISEWIKPKGSYALVSLGEWLYLGPYSQYREHFLYTHKPLYIHRLGWNAFSSPIRANPALIISNLRPDDENFFALADCSTNKTFDDNINSVKLSNIERIRTTDIKNVTDMRFVTHLDADEANLSEYADARSGLHAGDLFQFFKLFWEVEEFTWVWEPVQTAINETINFGGKEQIIRWEKEKGTLAALAESVKHLNHAAQNWRAGKPFWGKHGVVVGLMGKASCGLFTGQRFDVNSSAIIPKEKEYLPAIWAFCESGAFSEQARLLDNSLKLAPRTLLKVNFNLKKWSKVAGEKYPNGLPNPYTNDPTQWIFHGHPCGAVIWDDTEKWTATAPPRTDATVLQVAVARLLGYRWPAETDPDMELADEQRQWVDQCETLLPFADEDGLVPLPSVRGEPSAADRILNLLAAAYGDAWSTSTLSELLKNAAHAGKSLDTWLRHKFFTQHCKLFHHRPFIWHIWDGLTDGFSILANYHKLDYKTLETLIYTYLGDWIKRQKDDQQQGIDGAEEKLAAAETLRKKLQAILEGDAPLDIFVRWKPLHQQPIGWNPDLNDGVRLNIRPFMTVADVKKKDAGVLRDKPNIKWTKDRGKDVASAPWFHLGPQYGGKEGNRINDHHLTLAEKRAAKTSA